MLKFQDNNTTTIATFEEMNLIKPKRLQYDSASQADGAKQNTGSSGFTLFCVRRRSSKFGELFMCKLLFFFFLICYNDLTWSFCWLLTYRSFIDIEAGKPRTRQPGIFVRAGK